MFKGGRKHTEFIENVHHLRNKVTFHYSENRLFEKAISYRAHRKNGKNSSITISNDIRYRRFNIADEIIDITVCHLLWKITDDSKLEEETDRRAQFCFELCKAFLNFCGEFSFRYIKENALK
ncbi:MAG TPA: hypothetical protein VHZ76_07525 [Gammaproteobacteria bacterium]|jgi:hypothetical protein|nr:hypothetical protein [Gammaproteobacteria bacterium]